MRKTIVGCAALALACLAACSGGGVEGTYANVDNRAEYLELRRDGTFYLKAENRELSGRYAVDGKTIVLNAQSKMTAKGKIEKGMITDNDGTRWKK